MAKTAAIIPTKNVKKTIFRGSGCISSCRKKLNQIKLGSKPRNTINVNLF
jgi:hypothetical protein